MLTEQKGLPRKLVRKVLGPRLYSRPGKQGPDWSGRREDEEGVLGVPPGWARVTEHLRSAREGERCSPTVGNEVVTDLQKARQGT